MPITRRRRVNPPDQPENNNHNVEQPAEALTSEQAPSPVQDTLEALPPALPPTVPPMTNGDRIERVERQERQEYPPYSAPHQMESARRTARGELFRRAPQPPQQLQPPLAQQAVPAGYQQSAGPQAPTHEIALPLGNLLHLAYNPGYTGSEEARSRLLHYLSEESKAGGRARCWNCGSI